MQLNQIPAKTGSHDLLLMLLPECELEIGARLSALFLLRREWNGLLETCSEWNGLLNYCSYNEIPSLLRRSLRLLLEALGLQAAVRVLEALACRLL